MNSDIISKSILNEIEDVVYIADTSTYELYYMNGSCRKLLGVTSDSQWHRHKCYAVLQGLDKPCAFCTNSKLTDKAFYNWEHYNALVDKYYDIQDKLVFFEGINARLEIAKDVTVRKRLEQDLLKRLEEQEALNNCIATLHTDETPSKSIDKLLGLIAQYHEAERGYIFALSEDKSVVNNTYEWCAEGVEPQIEFLQNIDAEIVAHWFKKYEEVGEFYIDSINEELDQESEEYEILAAQAIDSLVTAPLYNMDKELVGFMGVDNPRKNIKHTSVIRAVTNFVSNFLDKNEQLEKLHRISYFDNLTGLQNRHSYSNKIKSLTENPPNTLGVVYVDINGLKVINDKYGHKEGDAYILSVSNFLNELYDSCAYRIGGDEFVMLCEEKEEQCFEKKLETLTAFINQGEAPKAAIGYCWRAEDCQAIEQIEIADREMYAEKERQYAVYSGKNEIFREKYLTDANHHGAV